MLLLRSVAIAVVAAACLPAPRESPPAPVSSTANVALPPEAEDVVARTNAERARLALRPLARSAQLMKAAQLHADQMAATRKMEHDLPGTRYPTPRSRLDAAGYRAVASGENVAEGHSSATTVVAGWMTSPHHRDNIISIQFTEMGAGYTLGSNGRRYWVQVFGRPR